MRSNVVTVPLAPPRALTRLGARIAGGRSDERRSERRRSSGRYPLPRRLRPDVLPPAGRGATRRRAVASAGASAAAPREGEAAPRAPRRPRGPPPPPPPPPEPTADERRAAAAAAAVHGRRRDARRRRAGHDERSDLPVAPGTPWSGWRARASRANFRRHPIDAARTALEAIAAQGLDRRWRASLAEMGAAREACRPTRKMADAPADRSGCLADVPPLPHVCFRAARARRKLTAGGAKRIDQRTADPERRGLKDELESRGAGGDEAATGRSSRGSAELQNERGCRSWLNRNRP